MSIFTESICVSCFHFQPSPIALTLNFETKASRSVILKRTDFPIFENGIALDCCKFARVLIDTDKYFAACALRKYPV